jgi:HEPN domain-containing protein/predicted nucleotidyltransferase
MNAFSTDTLSRIPHIDQSEMSVIVDRLVDVYHPLRIYLFGSHAWGTPTAESDYDLCVIVEKSEEKRWNRSLLGHNALSGIRRAIDLIVYTASEFERAVSHPSTMASPINLKGVLLYDRIPPAFSHWKVPLKPKECYPMIDVHTAWIFRAERDLRGAEVMVRQDDPIEDVAIYHTQQCAEKALKAFLAYNRLEIEKTHNLGELVDQCAVFDPAFASLKQDAEYLTPKATEFRYFGNLEEIDDVSQLVPSVEEVESAIVKAKRILYFFKAKISGKDDESLFEKYE